MRKNNAERERLVVTDELLGKLRSKIQKKRLVQI